MSCAPAYERLRDLTRFTELGLHKQVLKAVSQQGYDTPTPIQAQAIPPLLEGRDLLGIAQTGTGKTAAFALPTLHHLVSEPRKRRSKTPRVLVLSPTRELALQIAESFTGYGAFMDCRVETVFGGVKIGRQIRNMERGCEVVVATPGRLVDLMQQGAIELGEVEILILDEADQMLDMGFIHDLKKIMARVPDTRQTLLLSATMPKLIGDLAQRYLTDPVRVSIAPESTTAERVDQGVIHVANGDKLAMLEAVLSGEEIERALVFTRTKHGADKVVRKLLAKGIQAQAIHGNKSQNQRVKALDAFRAGKCPVLIATDIAARGIDVDGISHVLNFEMPNVAEQYVHRIGRTARAGRAGSAVSLVAGDELYYLREIEKVTRSRIPVLPAPEGCEAIALPEPDRNMRVIKPKGPGRGQGGGGGGGKPRGQRQGARGKPAGQAGGGGKPGGRKRQRQRASASAG